MSNTLNRPAYPESVDGATLREYAAIKLRVPDSGNDELDAMIRESRRLDYADLHKIKRVRNEP